MNAPSTTRGLTTLHYHYCHWHTTKAVLRITATTTEFLMLDGERKLMMCDADDNDEDYGDNLEC